MEDMDQGESCGNINASVKTPAGCSEVEADSSQIECDSDNETGKGKLETSIFTSNGGNGSGSIINSGGYTGSASSLVPNLTKRSVTLQMLLAAGILKPGDGTMSLEYHGQKFVGDLLSNGQIRSQETSQMFSSPSAWATACKQIINPDKNTRKSGCGWASIKYRSLKLDYYKTVWFKRLREGSIDVRHISNGASSSSDDSDDDDTDTSHCILKFGEHFDSPAQELGSKVLISCTEFKDMERLQPFHVKVSCEALALADFHCNSTCSESVGYISGHWNGDQNCLKMEVAHPCLIVMSESSTVDCDNERNRIALDIQRLGHEVVGWYHSHPRAPALPSKDDILRQLDYQIMMKGASESSYVPCVGVIISPLCYSNQENSKRSPIEFFWVMPPPENRPMEMGRPMQITYETYLDRSFDANKLLVHMRVLLDFYKGKKELVEINEMMDGSLQKLKETLSSWIPALKENDDYWAVVKQLFSSRSVNVTPPPRSTLLPVSSVSSVENDRETESEPQAMSLEN